MKTLHQEELPLGLPLGKGNSPDPRPVIAFVKRFWHTRAKRYIYAPPGRAFPIRAKV